MTWVKIDDAMTEHPKVIGLSDKAFRAHVRGLCYASRHLTDGFVPDAAAKPWGARFVQELVVKNVWELAENGYEIHDFLDWNPSRTEVEDIRNKRSEAGRRGGQRSKPSSKKEANASDMSEAKRNPVPVPIPIEEDSLRSSSSAIVTNRPRNEEWDGLAAVFGYSAAGAEAKLWGRLVVELRALGATKPSIEEAARRYSAHMPTVTLTPTALVKHYQRLTAGPATPTSNGRVGQKADRTLELARQAHEREQHAGQ